MNFKDAKVGQRLKVTFEGTVEESTDYRGKYFKLDNPAGDWFTPEAFDIATSIEVISPTWQDGDIVVFCFPSLPASVRTRMDGNWLASDGKYSSVSDFYVTSQFANGFATVLRDGKPVVTDKEKESTP